MKKVQIGSALGAGWSLFKNRPWYLLGLTLGFIGLMVLTSGGDAIVTALAYIIYGGYVAVLLKHFAGEHIVLDDLFDLVDKRWIYFAFLGVIKNLLIILGFFCLIIPGVYLAIRWMFAELYVIDKGMRPMEALKASAELTSGVRWKLLLYALVVGLLISVSLLALVIGAIVAAIVVQLATIKIYRDLESASAETHHEENHQHDHHEEHHHPEHHG